VKATPAEIEKYLKDLADTPARIALLTAAAEEARLNVHSEQDPWSVNYILSHLRSCADVWGDSIRRMLAEDRPTLPHISPRQWIRRTNYPTLPFRESFPAFTAQREELLKVLRKLSSEEWSRSAIIKAREHTVFTQARRLALHENEHCEQIFSLLK
jgi:hypothetical protein